jgi:hypothetical protein
MCRDQTDRWEKNKSRRTDCRQIGRAGDLVVDHRNGPRLDAAVAAGVSVIGKPRDAHSRDIVARVAFVLDPDGVVTELA